MKTFRQLVREFWFPLTVAVAWTVYNMAAVPRSQWNVRQAVNVLGPSFFFVSWLVAQWYRVKKQQRVEDDLSAIQAGVRAIQEPLLPCALFLTLRIDTTQEHVQRLFGDQEGYRAYEAGKPMPDPPLGVPRGTIEGRLLLTDRFIDFREGSVEGAGLFRLNHPGYNLIQSSVKHTIARLLPDEESSEHLRAEPLLSPASARVELFANGRCTGPGSQPTLALESGMHGGEVTVAYAVDEAIFADVLVMHLSPVTGNGVGMSARSLLGMYLRVTLDFFFIEDIQQYPETSWPTLLNLQLWLGGTGRQLLTFSAEQLAGHVRRANPSPAIARGAGAPQIVYECKLDEAVLSSGLLAVS